MPTRKPASGPAIPISASTFRFFGGSCMEITAPSVPNGLIKRKRDEERQGDAGVVLPAGKVMAEFVRAENGEETQGKGQAGGEVGKTILGGDDDQLSLVAQAVGERCRRLRRGRRKREPS